VIQPRTEKEADWERKEPEDGLPDSNGRKDWKKKASRVAIKKSKRQKRTNTAPTPQLDLASRRRFPPSLPLVGAVHAGLHDEVTSLPLALLPHPRRANDHARRDIPDRLPHLRPCRRAHPVRAEDASNLIVIRGDEPAASTSASKDDEVSASRRGSVGGGSGKVRAGVGEEGGERSGGWQGVECHGWRGGRGREVRIAEIVSSGGLHSGDGEPFVLGHDLGLQKIR
jgi:hypothetical protein